jgi:putative transposase
MRASRKLVESATYYVSSEVNRGEMALERSEFKKLFLEVVKEAKLKYDFELWNFIVLGSMFYFLIKPGKGESLSKIMQWIKCTFTRRWNKRHHIRGHLWGERFFSRIIEDEQDFERMSEFIDRCPVTAKLVKTAKEWRFGGLFHKLRGIFGLVDELLEGDLLFPTSIPSAG